MAGSDSTGTPDGLCGSESSCPPPLHHQARTDFKVQALTAVFHYNARCRRTSTNLSIVLSCFSVLRFAFAGIPDLKPAASRLRAEPTLQKHAPPMFRRLRIQALSSQHKAFSPITSNLSGQVLGTSLGESPRARKARSRPRRRLPRRRKPVLSRHLREGGDESRISCKVCLADVQLKCSEGSSTGVLKCPQCCDLIHQRCMVPILEETSAPSCPSCRFAFSRHPLSSYTFALRCPALTLVVLQPDGVDANTSSFWVPEDWQLSQRWWNSFWDSDDPDYCASSADESFDASSPPLADAGDDRECKTGRGSGRNGEEGEGTPRRSPRKRPRPRMVLDANDILHCHGTLSCTAQD